LVKTEQKLLVAGDIKSPQNRSLRVKEYQAVRMTEEVKTLRERATIIALLRTLCVLSIVIPADIKQMSYKTP